MARTKLVALVVLGNCSVLLGAQRIDSARGAIDSYRAAIELARNDPTRGRLEAAFDAIGPLRTVLVLRPDGGNTFLESLSEREFAALRRELVGLVVNREEVVLVEPDTAFFRGRAARGDRADRAFFAAFGATYPRSVWPVYIEQQTDYSGCTRFGSGTLVSTYRAWAAFRREYPRRYKTASGNNLENVVKEVTGSTCACGDRASVERELTEFGRRADTPDVRAKVEARVVALRRDGANIRFGCTSG